MDRGERSHGWFSDTWRYALLGGAASIPVTVAGHWLSAPGSQYSLDAVLVAGLVVGYLAAGRTVDADAAGLRAGAIGGLPALAWLVPRILGDVTALSGPAWFESVGVAFVVATTATVAVLVLALAALFGFVGARIGGWVAGLRGQPTGQAA